MKKKTKIHSTLISGAAMRVMPLCAALCLAAPALAQSTPSWGDAEEGTLAVTSLLMCRDVQDREPQGVDFAPRADGERIYAHLKLLNKGEAQQVKITWKLAGKNFHHFYLNVGRSAQWRTWAYLTLDEAKLGPWTVEVRDEEGTLLAAMPFLVLEPEKPRTDMTVARLAPAATAE